MLFIQKTLLGRTNEIPTKKIEKTSKSVNNIVLPFLLDNLSYSIPTRIPIKYSKILENGKT